MLADFASVFRVDLAGLPYEKYVGMILNMPRIFSRPALATALGVGYALSDEDVPAELFDGVTHDYDQAAELAADTNVERRFSREKRKHRGRS